MDLSPICPHCRSRSNAGSRSVEARRLRPSHHAELVAPASAAILNLQLPGHVPLSATVSDCVGRQKRLLGVLNVTVSLFITPRGPDDSDAKAIAKVESLASSGNSRPDTDNIRITTQGDFTRHQIQMFLIQQVNQHDFSPKRSAPVNGPTRQLHDPGNSLSRS